MQASTTALHVVEAEVEDSPPSLHRHNLAARSATLLGPSVGLGASCPHEAPRAQGLKEAQGPTQCSHLCLPVPQSTWCCWAGCFRKKGLWFLSSLWGNHGQGSEKGLMVLGTTVERAKTTEQGTGQLVAGLFVMTHFLGKCL